MPRSSPCRGTTSRSTSARCHLMRWLVLSVLSVLSVLVPGIATLRADTVEPIVGEPVTGKVDLDFGGGVFRSNQGPAVKLDFTNLYRIRFDNARDEECVPGVVLTDGTRLA